MIRLTRGIGAASRRRGRPLRVLGLVLGGWVALRLVMVCLAVPAGADVTPPWQADRASLLAVRPAGGAVAQGRYADHARAQAQARARHRPTIRPAGVTPGEDLLTVSVQVADFDRLRPAVGTWHAALLALLDEERMARPRD